MGSYSTNSATVILYIEMIPRQPLEYQLVDETECGFPVYCMTKDCAFDISKEELHITPINWRLHLREKAFNSKTAYVRKKECI